MAYIQLNSKPNKLNRKTVFSIINKLGIYERSVLSLKYFDNLSIRQISDVMGMNNFGIYRILFITHIKLKYFLIISGNSKIALKKFIITFGKLTAGDLHLK